MIFKYGKLIIGFFFVSFSLHASVLKLELKGEEFPLSDDKLTKIHEILSRCDAAARVAFDGMPTVLVATTTTTTTSTEASTTVVSESEELGAPPAKMKKSEEHGNDFNFSSVDAIIKSETLWASVSQTCLKGLELIVQRFPQHFKALHLLGHYYMRSKRNKDMKKARRYLWGSDMPTSARSAAQAPSLFGERKNTNLFNGIWRMPLNEADRPGTFSTHMGKCVNTLLEYANHNQDYQILLEVAVLLRKVPNSDQKFLYEKQRKAFSKQGYADLKKVLRSRADSYRSNKSKEMQLSLLLEIHQIYSRVRKTLHPQKDEVMTAIMTDLYKSIGGAATALYEEVNTFCNKATIAEKTMGPKEILNAMPSMMVQKAVAPASKPAATSKPSLARQTSSTPTTSTAEANSVKAAMDYMNAASYYNEMMATMMMASAASGSTSTEAYLNAYAAASAASSYNDLIKTLPNTISVTKTDKKTVAVGSGNKNQTPSSSKPDAAGKMPPSVSVSKTNKSSNMVSKPKAPNSSGAASLQPCKPKLFSAATPSGPMNQASKSKLLPSTSSKSGGAKSASALAIEKIYKKAPSSAVMKQKTSLPGVTVSKVLFDNKVGSKKKSAAGAGASSGGASRAPSAISAAAVKTANEILMHERNANSKGKTNAVSNSARDQLKSFRSVLAKDIKKPSNSTAAAAAPAKPKVIEDISDDDVICID
jgi:calcineurin-binding protein cabin-1